MKEKFKELCWNEEVLRGPKYPDLTEGKVRGQQTEKQSKTEYEKTDPDQPVCFSLPALPVLLDLSPFY